MSKPVSQPAKTESDDVKKVPFYCYQCVAGPDLGRVEVRNGVAERIEANFDISDEHPGGGRVCVKAFGLIQKTYNPNRVKQPMKRTNPKKGRDEDPGFVPISWEEAFQIIGDKFREVRAKGLLNESGQPRLATSTGGGGTPVQYMGTFPAFMAAWGPIDQGYGAGQGVKCYHSEHLYGELWHRAFIVSPDTPYVNFILNCGANTEAQGGVVGIWREANARARGAKRIHVEPHMSITAATSAEWVPIKPKTDAAFLFSLIHRIIHERGWAEVCDVPHLKNRTNSPYLVGPNGYFMRDRESGKPLIWDASDGSAKPHDAEIGDAALDGAYTVAGYEEGPDNERWDHDAVEAKPSFQLFLDHMAPYTPEWAQAESDVPAETIRRIADEFLAHACVGETIEIEGKTLPFRPVAVMLGKSVNNGWGGFHTCWARTMLVTLVGALEVPGGTLGTAVKLVRPAASRTGSVLPGEDGFMRFQFNPTSSNEWNREPHIRNAYKTLVPLVSDSPWSPALGPAHLPWLFQKHQPDSWPKTIPPDIWICYRTNPAISSWNAPEVAKRLAEFPFIVAFTYTYDETNHFADVLLPESTDFESTQLIRIGGTKFQENFWHHQGWAIRAKAIDPVGDTMDMSDIITRFAQEAGILDEYIDMINNGAAGTRLARKDKYDYSLPKGTPPESEQVWDNMCKAASWDLTQGEQVNDLDWFREHGYMLNHFPQLDWYIYPAMERQNLRFELPYQERLTRHGAPARPPPEGDRRQLVGDPAARIRVHADLRILPGDLAGLRQGLRPRSGRIPLLGVDRALVPVRLGRQRRPAADQRGRPEHRRPQGRHHQQIAGARARHRGWRAGGDRIGHRPDRGAGGPARGHPPRHGADDRPVRPLEDALREGPQHAEPQFGDRHLAQAHRLHRQRLRHHLRQGLQGVRTRQAAAAGGRGHVRQGQGHRRHHLCRSGGVSRV